MIYLNYLILLLCATVGLTKVIKKAEANLEDDGKWLGKYFPYKPGQPHIIADPVKRPLTKYQKLLKAHQPIELVDDEGNWQGKWFPYKPNEPHIIKDPIIKHRSCDDGMIGINIDYDPADKRNNFNYLCLDSNRGSYKPNLNRTALLHEHFVPAAYVPPIKCLNESINYESKLTPPTYGAFRPLKAKYGVYAYLPPQRWLRNLAEGAIVMLYHPCANSRQVEQLSNTLVSCMYRHIVTPYAQLSAERPMALLAWGKILEMSVFDVHLVVDFIGKYAKRGPLSKLYTEEYTKRTYSAGLVKEAHLITDIEDGGELCGFLRM